MTSAPASALPSVEAPLTEKSRLVYTLFSPSRTFADIRRNASWWGPWLVVSVFSLLFAVTLNKVFNYEALIRSQIAHSKIAAEFPKMTQAQQNAIIHLRTTAGHIAAYAVPVTSFIKGLILAGFFLGVFNFLFKAAIPFSRSLAVVFYSMLPSVVTHVLSFVELLRKGGDTSFNLRNPVPTNPAYFMNLGSSSSFTYGIAAALDVVTIWMLVLLGIGFAINSENNKVSKAKGIAVVVLIYVLYKAIFLILEPRISAAL